MPRRKKISKKQKQELTEQFHEPTEIQESLQKKRTILAETVKTNIDAFISVYNLHEKTTITKEQVALLWHAFLHDHEEAVACLYANVTLAQYREFLKLNPAFKEKFEFSKDLSAAQAQENVIRTVEEGDVDVSMWYLERKKSDKYSKKTVTEHQHTLSSALDDLERQKETQGPAIIDGEVYEGF